MKQIVTKGIVLARTNYGEADRIVTILTPDQGKLRLMVRGARKSKSKLAGGIELFSVSDITFIRGKADIGTMISARLHEHYGNIVQDLDRTMLGYELIKQLNKAIEDVPEPEYFTLLEQAFEALDASKVPLELIQAWFRAQLLKYAGHAPNLQRDTVDQALTASQSYSFSFDDMAFTRDSSGQFDATRIKLLRLLFSDNSPLKIAQVQSISGLLPDVAPLLQAMARTYIRS